MSLITKVEGQIAVVQSKFEELTNRQKDLQTKRAEIDKQLSAILEEQIRLQGEFRALNALKEGVDAEEKEPKSTMH